MNEYTLTAECEVRFRPVSLTELESAYPTLSITFRHTPGYPAQGPSYSSGGEPGAGAEVTLVSAEMVDPGDLGFEPDPTQIQEWAADYLDSEHGYTHACRVADEESGPDPDQAYEEMRDRRDER